MARLRVKGIAFDMYGTVVDVGSGLTGLDRERAVVRC